MSDKKSKGEQLGESLRAKGLALSIPLALVGYPLIGVVIGKYLVHRTGYEWILPVCLLVSLLMAGRECVKILQRLSAADK